MEQWSQPIICVMQGWTRWQAVICRGHSKNLRLYNQLNIMWSDLDTKLNVQERSSLLLFPFVHLFVIQFLVTALFGRWHTFWYLVKLWMTEPCCFWYTGHASHICGWWHVYLFIHVCLCMSSWRRQSNRALVGECICLDEWQQHCGYRGMVALME